MRYTMLISLILILLQACGPEGETIIPDPIIKKISPPFWGTIFIDPDIVTPSDPTAFLELAYTGQESRVMYDRRANDWITVDAFLYNADFDDGLSIEIQVNPEFGDPETAEVEAVKYAPVIGQLSTALRKDVQTVWIHKGINPFGGGNNNLLIHTGQADEYIRDGILEETFIHEASHTSLDAYHAGAPGWLKAQDDDPTFISEYAKDNPTREDIAESYLTYFAIKYRSDRISVGLADTILSAIPNRINYFEGLVLDMHPVE